MRFLEIRTKRIFNNLIKKNQKLVSDSVLKQTSETVSSVLKQWGSESVFSNSVQCPEPNLQSVAFRVQRPGSRVQGLASRVQHPGSSVQRPASRVQRLEASVQRPASNICVQIPEIPVCLPSISFKTNSCEIQKNTFENTNLHKIL